MTFAKGQFNCPQCFSALEIKALNSAFVICDRCRSMINKEGPGLQKLEKAGPVSEDMTPIKIATTGRVGNKSFEVIGRIRFERDEGYLNQWCILFSDETTAYLGESYGDYSIYFQQSYKIEPVRFANASPPRIIQLPNKKEYSVVRVKNVLFSQYEGEYMKEPFYRNFISVELNNNDGDMAIVNISFKKEAVAYAGKIYEFDELNFLNLRNLNDWT